MPKKRPSNKRIRTLCAEVSPEDGTDPREWLKGLHGPKARDPKVRRLCGQVADVLSLVLAAEPDEVLNGIDIASVEPAPDSKQLLVTVRPLFNDNGIADPGPILDALARASPRLRSEVASAITRRRAPMLIYRVLIEGELPRP